MEVQRDFATNGNKIGELACQKLARKKVKGVINIMLPYTPNI